MDHIVMFSSGIGSTITAKLVAEKHGTENLVLLFADTHIEDEDNYRFLHQTHAWIGGRLVIVSDGRTPWEVFRAERYIGNTRHDPCSKILKRELMDRWVAEHYKPDTCVRYYGIGWNEEHRIERVRERLPEWNIQAPLCSPPYLEKEEMLAMVREAGIEPPHLYSLGFPHANCGDFCVKAGQAQFALLYKTMPCRYLHHEREEEAMRQYLGKDVSILRDRRKAATSTVLTLRAFRERLEADEDFDRYEWGGCGCALD